MVVLHFHNLNESDNKNVNLFLIFIKYIKVFNKRMALKSI